MKSEVDELRSQLARLERRVANQRSEIKNRLLRINGMERENAWLRDIKKRVRTALGLDGETLKTGISDPAEAAKELRAQLSTTREIAMELAAALECYVWERTNKQKYGAREKGDIALAKARAAGLLSQSTPEPPQSA